MSIKEKTLSEMIIESTERLQAQKAAADANISKLTRRVNATTESVEKARLQALVELQTRHRASLDTVDVTAQATENWNELQDILNGTSGNKITKA